MTLDPNSNAASPDEINETTANQSENATREDATGGNAPHVWLPAPDSPTASAPDSPATMAQARRSGAMTWLIVGAALLVLALRFPAAAKTTVVFIFILSVLVFVHEWGHYQFARWGGMKVNRFAIGFPPFIYTRRHNGIDYSIGALPIGGMVDIAGLGSEEEMVTTAKQVGTAGTTVTNVAAEHPLDSARVEDYLYSSRRAPHGQKQFQDASLGWRFWTLFAGPLMNFIYAAVVFIGLYSIVGVRDAKPLTTLEYVMPNMPAAAAGLKKGDRIVSINGIRSTDPKVLAKQIPLSKGNPITVTFERKGEVIRRTLHPAWQGEGAERQLMLGIQWEQKILPPKKVGFATALDQGWLTAKSITTDIFGILHRALTFRLSQEDRRGVGGPIKIAEAVGESARSGLYDLVGLSAALSVNLGLLNLLPFPALDGGRILFLGYELIARRPLDPAKENIAHMVGMVMLLAFMLFITLRDVLTGLKIF